MELSSLGLVEHPFNPSTQKAEEFGSLSLSQSGLYVSYQGYILRHMLTQSHKNEIEWIIVVKVAELY